LDQTENSEGNIGFEAAHTLEVIDYMKYLILFDGDGYRRHQYGQNYGRQLWKLVYNHQLELATEDKWLFAE